MPRFGFGSPSGGRYNLDDSSGGGGGSSSGGGISLNSPRRKKSARETNPTKPTRSNSRRRNFGFLKSGVGKSTEKSSSAQTREHAKQLAHLAAFSSSTDPFGADDADPTSIATTVATTISDSSSPHHHHQWKKKDTSNTTNTTNTNSNPSFEAFGGSGTMGQSTNLFEADFFSTTTNTNTNTTSTRTPNRATTRQKQIIRSNSGTRHPPISLENFFDGRGSPDRRSQITAADSSCSASASVKSTISSVGGASVTQNNYNNTSSSISSNNAAARRRMRNHMNKNQNYSRRQGVGGGGETTASLGSNTASLSFHRDNSVHSFTSQGGSGGGSGGGSMNSGLFDLNNVDGGFSFDAFGLDESQVEREVNDAMQHLFGNNHPRNFNSSGNSSYGSGISIGGSNTSNHDGLFPSIVVPNNNNNNNKKSSYSSYNSQNSSVGFHSGSIASSEDSFLQQSGWDSASPNTSRAGSPVPPSGHHTVVATRTTPGRGRRREEEEGNANITTSSFDDGFHITRAPQQQESNPWKEDPWATSSDNDCGRQQSDFFRDPFQGEQQQRQQYGCDESSGPTTTATGTTARKLYSETQSDVQDYYRTRGGEGKTGVAIATTNALMNANDQHRNGGSPSMTMSTTKGPSYSDTKSDIGGSRQQRVQTFFELPPTEEDEEMRTQHRYDQHDDTHQMQEDMTHEYAKDLVRRISKSPSEASGSRSSHQSRRSRSNQSNMSRMIQRENQKGSQNDDHCYNEDYNRSNQQRNTREQSKSTYSVNDNTRGNANADDDEGNDHAIIENSDRLQEQRYQSHHPQSYSDFNNNYEHIKGHPDKRYIDEGKNETAVAATSNSSQSRYGNLRSRFESKSKSNSDGVNRDDDNGPARIPQSSTTTPTRDDVNQSKGYNVSEASIIPKSDPQMSSSPAVPKWKQRLLSSPQRIPIVGKDNQGRIEDKKGEDLPKSQREHQHEEAGSQPQTQRIGSLKARWEAQSRPSSVGQQRSIPNPLPRKPIQTSEQTKQSIGNLDNSFEMLTPAIVEERRQELKKNKFANLRKSMGVVDNNHNNAEEITRMPQHPRPHYQQQESKSDSGGWRDGGSALEKVTNRIRRESSSPGSIHSPGFDRFETKSDGGGSTPSFLTNIKLRKIASPSMTAGTSTPSPTATLVQERNVNVPSSSIGRKLLYENSNKSEQESSIPAPPSRLEKKLTYRERREIELEAQRENEENYGTTPQTSPTKDVASLIRKRIAANKAKSSPDSVASTSTMVTTISTALDRLKPTPKEVSNNNHEPYIQSRMASSLDVDDQPNQTITHRHHQPNLNNVLPSVSESHTALSIDTTSASDCGRPNAPYREIQHQPQVQLSPPKNPSKVLETLFSARKQPPSNPSSPGRRSSPVKSPHQMLENFLSVKNKVGNSMEDDVNAGHIKPDVTQKVPVPDDVSQSDVKSMLSGFLSQRAPPALPCPKSEDDAESLKKHHVRSPLNSPSMDEEESFPPPAPPPTYSASGNIPALKDDPKFERYLRMLKMGLPIDVAKHAMIRDGLDPSILDHDHNKPVGPPLKDDPKFQKYFKMLKMGIQIGQVKHCLAQDGLNPDIMDQDHNIPVVAIEKRQMQKKKETHRRARLHWKTITTVVKNSLWSTVDKEVDDFEIDEEEFNELFQVDLKESAKSTTPTTTAKKKGAAVRVIDAKRANNGGIILARLKMTHDQMADAVDRIDAVLLTAEQIENIIGYLPTKEERDALEKYMLDGGQDAAEKFDGLCECEKFMVSMMTVKHAKRKIKALLFKLQFMKCLESIAKDAQMIDTACDQLVNSNRLRQLLGIILQFGNRLNTAGSNSKRKAGAFSLDSLSKLSQAKAFDKKTTFLHYIILIVQRNNEILLKFYDDIPTVLEAEKIFWDQCQQDLEEVENQLENVRRISLHESKAKERFLSQPGNDDESLGEMELTLEEEVMALRATPTGMFTLGAIKQVSALREKIEETKKKCARVKEYFGETGKDTSPTEIFSAFSKFTRDFQKAKDEVFSTVHKRLREDRKKARIQTPNKSRSLPPKNLERSRNQPLMRASSHQPNMGKLFSDIQQRQSSSTASASVHGSSITSNGPSSSRAGLLHSIKEQKSSPETNISSSRAGLLNSIKEQQSQPMNNIGASKAGLMDAIQRTEQYIKHDIPNAVGRTAIKERQLPSAIESTPKSNTSYRSENDLRVEINDRATIPETPPLPLDDSRTDIRPPSERSTHRRRAMSNRADEKTSASPPTQDSRVDIQPPPERSSHQARNATNRTEFQGEVEPAVAPLHDQRVDIQSSNERSSHQRRNMNNNQTAPQVDVAPASLPEPKIGILPISERSTHRRRLVFNRAEKPDEATPTQSHEPATVSSHRRGLSSHRRSRNFHDRIDSTTEATSTPTRTPNPASPSPPSISTHSRSTHMRESMRQKALRRQRYTTSNQSSSDNSSTPQNNDMAAAAAVAVANVRTMSSSNTTTKTTRSPRETMRNHRRQRVEAAKARRSS